MSVVGTAGKDACTSSAKEFVIIAAGDLGSEEMALTGKELLL
jgi:hypothetical protein